MRDYRGNRKHINPWLRVSEVAEMLKCSAATVRNYVRSGLLQCDYNLSKQRVFTKDMVEEFRAKMLNQPIPTKERKVFYVRSSSSDKHLIDSQIKLLVAKFGEPHRIYKDVGFSGLNENRRGLLSMLKDAANYHFDVICATHPDRITRFGINYLSIYLAQNNVTMQFLDDHKQQSLHEELMGDFMSLIASFSGKFYRIRGYEQQKALLETASKSLDKRKSGTIDDKDTNNV